MYKYLLIAVLVMGVMLSSSLAQQNITAVASVPQSISVTFSYNTINYGSVFAGTTNNQVFEFMSTVDSLFYHYVSGALNVTVNTNTNYQFSIISTDFTTPGGSIPASNHKFNAVLGSTTSQYGTITEPSTFLTLETTRYFSKTITSVGTYYDYHFYRLDVPATAKAGGYAATVTITYSAV